MIVVDRLIRLSGVVDDAVLECDAALGQAIGELKIVERGQPRRRLDLRRGEPLEPRCVLEIGRDVADRNVLRGDAEGLGRDDRDPRQDRSSHPILPLVPP